MKKRYYIDLLVLFFVLVGGYFAVNNAVAIGDWWFFRSYTPSDQVEQLANSSGMSDFGKRLFYRMDPQFVNRREMNAKCDSDALGCTVGRNIFILNEFTEKQYNRSIVTASHEMLHVGWSRLTTDEISNLESELNIQIDLISDNLYDKFSSFEGEDYYNEAHSYIGTEESDLTPELTKHYGLYFDDRQKTLDALAGSPEN